MLRTYLIKHLPNSNVPEPVPSGPIPSSRPTGYSPAAIELMGFKMGIKREIAAYPSLKDKRYFDGFKRSLFIVAKTHECNEVLDPNYTPGCEREAQASQAKHGSLVDRGANGGLAGSDVRILSRSSRKCTVTGIDCHELQVLDVVQYAWLVETNHGIV